MTNATPWSAEDIELAIKYWTVDGLSASQIARRFRGRSRNAVISLLHRKIGKGANAPKPAFRAVPSAPTAGAVRRPRAIPETARAPKISAPPPPPDRAEDGQSWPLTTSAVALVELAPCHCRWPVGLATGAEQLFCGQARGAGPYCPDHARQGGSALSPQDWARRNAKALQRAMAS